VSQKRCVMLLAGSLRASRRGVIHHALARTTHRGCAEGRIPFDKGLGGATSPSSSPITRECRDSSLPGVLWYPPTQLPPKSGGAEKRSVSAGSPRVSLGSSLFSSPKSGGQVVDR